MPNLDINYALLLSLAKAAIREGGGEYVGIQAGVRQAGSPDLVLFNDPMTRTTLALVADQALLTAQQVQDKIAQSRRLFAEIRLRRDDRRNVRQEAPRRSLWGAQAEWIEAP